MIISGLPPEDRDLIVAFIELARRECAESDWEDIESQLASSWARMRHKTAPEWRDVLAYVRRACEGGLG